MKNLRILLHFDLFFFKKETYNLVLLLITILDMSEKPAVIPVYTNVSQIHPQIDPKLACPSGGEHRFQREFTLVGLLWAVLCFPCGIICLLRDRETRCEKCQTVLYHSN